MVYPKVLSNVSPGTSVKLVKIEGPDDQIGRLSEMGLTTDVELKVLTNRSFKSKQPLLVLYRNTQLALSRQVSDTMYVSPME